MFRLVISSCLFLAVYALPNGNTKPTEQRIVGGRSTQIVEVPYQASLQYKNQHTCGASIIGPKHILTAAHCFLKRDTSLFSVRVGSDYHNKGGQVVKVEKVKIHPEFTMKTASHDAAVLVLKEPLKIGGGVSIGSLGSVEPQVGEMILISGWGAMEKGKGATNPLQSAPVPVISKEDCRKKYGEKDPITEQMFCAGYETGEKDSCRGDSGGPAVSKDKIVGIVSWGEGCGNPDFPGVYTNIASILPWITAQIQN